MPIYRLKSNGNWGKLGAIYRLNSSGIWKKLGAIYRLNSSGIWKKIFPSGADTPTQLDAPGTPSGTPVSFQQIDKGTAGSYQDYNTAFGVVTKLIKLPLAVSPISGTETQYGTELSSPYTVTQLDGTTPVVKFWTQDTVKNVSGTKTFYYYSSGSLQARVGSISDDFNRTVASGLGTSSGGHIYSSYGNLASSWSVNGTRGVNSTAVSSGAAASSHPLRTVEIGSSGSNYSNRTYNLDIPDGQGGQGVAFWTTAADSWYAVSSYFDYDTATVNIVTCSTTGSYSNTSGTSTAPCESANPTGTTAGTRCGSCTYTGLTTTCTGTGTYSNTSGTSTAPCESTYPIGSNIGDRCGSCSYIGSQVQLQCTGTGTYSSSTSSSTSNCESANPITSTVGSRCGSCTYTGLSTTCTGTGGPYTNTSGTSVTPCNNAIPTGSNIGDRCGSCYYSFSSTSTSVVCNNYLTGMSSCPGTGTGTGVGQRCSSCTTTTTNNDTFGACRSTSLTPVCPSCTGGTTSFAQYNCSTGFWQCRCRITTTTYSYFVNASVTTTTYYFYYPIREASYNFTYPAYQNVTIYNFTYPSRVAQYNFTYPMNQTVTTTQYTYNSKIKIWSAISGTVVSQNWDNAGNSAGLITSNTRPAGESFDTSQFIGIYKIRATTNNNIVTAIAYNAGGSQIGSTLSKTFTSPTRYLVNFETSGGVIKAYTPNNVGTLYDNLAID